MDIKPSQPVPVLLQGWSKEERARAEASAVYLNTLARLESVTWLDKDAEPPEAAAAIAGQTTILIPMAGLIDKDAELARLHKELDKRSKEFTRLEGKLANANFVNKAPAAVVDKERARVKELGHDIHTLEAQIKRIQAL
jgi:valyl-tRNA synthetase